MFVTTRLSQIRKKNSTGWLLAYKYTQVFLILKKLILCDPHIPFQLLTNVFAFLFTTRLLKKYSLLHFLVFLVKTSFKCGVISGCLSQGMSETKRFVTSSVCMMGHASWWMTSFCRGAISLRTFKYQRMYPFSPLRDIYFYREKVFKLFPWVLGLELTRELEVTAFVMQMYPLSWCVTMKSFLFNFAREYISLMELEKGYFSECSRSGWFWRWSFLRQTSKQYSGFHLVALSWLLQYLIVPGFELAWVLQGYHTCSSSASSARIYLTFLHAVYIICYSSVFFLSSYIIFLRFKYFLVFSKMGLWFCFTLSCLGVLFVR